MSGHSKWASIKHKKAITDKKRGKLFTKLIREIIAASRLGGPDPSANPRLRVAVQTARSNNMPLDNIERAIKKGSGGLESDNYEEVVYEGYGPQGVAILATCLTDNKNRSAAEIRLIFTKAGGSMAGAGSVAWLFEKKGLIMVDKTKVGEEALMEAALAAGAEDMTAEGNSFEIITKSHDYETVKAALEKSEIVFESAQVTMIPKNQVKVTAESARSVLNLIDALEDHDDVQNVYANCDIPDEVMQDISKGS